MARYRPITLPAGHATRLTITADDGGSNGSRVLLWKWELQRLANEIGLDVVVHHLPPGTSKWNRIEHRLFSFISMNWKAKPLVSYRVIVDLIGATTTEAGLTSAVGLTLPSVREESSYPIRRWPALPSAGTKFTESGTIRFDHGNKQ